MLMPGKLVYVVCDQIIEDDIFLNNEPERKKIFERLRRSWRYLKRCLKNSVQGCRLDLVEQVMEERRTFGTW
jgi:hypothetical protein